MKIIIPFLRTSFILDLKLQKIRIQFIFLSLFKKQKTYSNFHFKLLEKQKMIKFSKHLSSSSSIVAVITTLLFLVVCCFHHHRNDQVFAQTSNQKQKQQQHQGTNSNNVNARPPPSSSTPSTFCGSKNLKEKKFRTSLQELVSNRKVWEFSTPLFSNFSRGAATPTSCTINEADSIKTLPIYSLQHLGLAPSPSPFYSESNTSKDRKSVV